MSSIQNYSYKDKFLNIYNTEIMINESTFINGSKNQINTNGNFPKNDFAFIVINGNENSLFIDDPVLYPNEIVINGENNLIYFHSKTVSVIKKHLNGKENRIYIDNRKVEILEYDSIKNITTSNILSDDQSEVFQLLVNKDFSKVYIANECLETNMNHSQVENNQDDSMTDNASSNSEEMGYFRQFFSDKLFVVNYQFAIDRIKKYGNIHELCVICCERFDLNEKVCLFFCDNHIFHNDCIKKWMLSSTSCPLCKYDCLREYVQKNSN